MQFHGNLLNLYARSDRLFIFVGDGFFSGLGSSFLFGDTSALHSFIQGMKTRPGFTDVHYFGSNDQRYLFDKLDFGENRCFFYYHKESLTPADITDQVSGTIGLHNSLERILKHLGMAGRCLDYVGIDQCGINFSDIEQIFIEGVQFKQLCVVFEASESTVYDWVCSMAQQQPGYHVFSPAPSVAMLVQKRFTDQSSGHGCFGNSKLWQVKTEEGIAVTVPGNHCIPSVVKLLAFEQTTCPALKFLKHYIQPGMKVLDIGAGYGFSSQLFASKVQESGRVWAFEPGITAYGCLAQPQTPHLVPVHKAMTEAIGRAALKNNGVDFAELVDGDCVDCVTGDAWWFSQGKPAIDVIHLDTGADVGGVLTSSQVLLRSCLPLIVFNYFGNGSVLNLLESLGFQWAQLNAFSSDTHFTYSNSQTSIQGKLIAFHPKLKRSMACYHCAPGKLTLTAREYISGLCLAGLAKNRQFIEGSIHAEFSGYYAALDKLVNGEHLAAARLLEHLQNNNVQRIEFVLLSARLAVLRQDFPLAITNLNYAAECMRKPEFSGLMLPFLPPLPEQDHVRLQSETKNEIDWLIARTLEAAVLIRMQRFTGSFKHLLPELKALARNPESSDFVPRLLALGMLAEGKKVKFSSKSLLVFERSCNAAIWREITASIQPKEMAKSPAPNLETGSFVKAIDLQLIEEAISQKDFGLAASMIFQAMTNGQDLSTGWVRYAHALAAAAPWTDMSRFLPQKTNFFEQSGWVESVKKGRPVDAVGKPIPWFTYPAIDFLEGILNAGWSILEWGSGNSTLWWARHCCSVLAIESDSSWFAEIKGQMPENVKLKLCPGRNEYVDAGLRHSKEKFDVIVIDGDHRNDCAYRCLNYLKPNGLIIFDNTDCADHRQGVDFLNQQGMYRIDFFGLIPSYLYRNNTSVFFWQPELLKSSQNPTVPKLNLGLSCGQAIDRLKQK